MTAANTLLATYFGIMPRLTEWLAEKDRPEEIGRAYLSRLHRASQKRRLVG